MAWPPPRTTAAAEPQITAATVQAEAISRILRSMLQLRRLELVNGVRTDAGNGVLLRDSCSDHTDVVEGDGVECRDRGIRIDILPEYDRLRRSGRAIAPVFSNAIARAPAA